MLLPLLLALAQAPAADAAPKPIESLPPLAPDAQSLSPDHKRIAIATKDEGVWVIDLSTREVIARMPVSKSPVQCIAWTADSKSLGLLDGDGGLAVVDATDGSSRRTLRTTDREGVHVAGRLIRFAVGDTVLIVASGDAPTDIYSVMNADLLARIGSCSMTALALSPNDDLIALGDSAGVVRLYMTRTGLPLEAKTTVPLGRDHRAVHALAFDPTGTIVAIGSGDCTVRLWKIGNDGGWLKELSHCDADMFGGLSIGSVEFSRDGSKLLSMSYDFWDARVWDIASARVLDHFDYNGGNPAAMRAWFSVDETRVVTSLGCRVGNIDPSNPRTSTTMNGDLKLVPGGYPPREEWAYYKHDGDYAWAVVDHHLVVRKIPDEQPILRIAVREK